MKKITLYKNQFVTYLLDTEKHIFEEFFHVATETMNEAEYRALTIKMVELLAEHEPKYIFADFTDMRYTISVELQAWADKLIGKAVKVHNVKKSALLVSQDFIAQVALELLAEEQNIKSNIILQFFAEENEARRWLED